MGALSSIIAIVSAVVGAASAVVGHMSSKKAAKQQQQQAALASQQAEEQAKREKERLANELRREQERIAYEKQLARDLFEQEMQMERENVDFAKRMEQEQTRELLSAQRVWAAAFGSEGSALNVMDVSTRRSDETMEEFERRYEQYKERRATEVEKVGETEDFTFKQFAESRKEETDYTVSNLMFEAAQFRRTIDASKVQEKYNTYGTIAKIGALATSAYTQATAVKPPTSVSVSGSFARTGSFSTGTFGSIRS